MQPMRAWIVLHFKSHLNKRTEMSDIKVLFE